MKYDTKNIQRLTEMLGHKECRHNIKRCSGKWAGTCDHSLVFEDGSRLFICNGADHFDEAVRNNIRIMENSTGENARIMTEMLVEQARKDGRAAEKEGLLGYKPIRILPVHDSYAVRVSVEMEVAGEIFLFLETGLSYALQKGPSGLKEYLEFKKDKEVYTAGGVEHPTFLIMNVRHSHRETLYRP